MCQNPPNKMNQSMKGLASLTKKSHIKPVCNEPNGLRINACANTTTQNKEDQHFYQTLAAKWKIL